MSVELRLETVKDVENTLRSKPHSTYAWCMMPLLKKWQNEDGLQKTRETQALIDKLISEFGKLYPGA